MSAAPSRYVRALFLCGLASAALVTASATFAGDQTTGTAQSTPTFRSGVRLIEVDVFVTDRDGQFVRGLTQDDFELVEDGTPQEIRTFSVVDLPTDVVAAASRREEDVEPDVVTNTTPEGRVYVILMDSPSTASPGGDVRRGPAYDYYAKAFARQFVEEAVGAGDYVAVVHVQGTFTDSQPFTTSRRLVIESIDRYGRGRSGDTTALTHPGSDLTGPEMVTRNMETYRAIEQLSQRLGAMNGRRKAILWIGGQMDWNPTDFPCPRPDPLAHCAVQAASPALLTAYRDAIGAATRHNVAIYPIDPSGLTTTLLGELERMAALRMVAEDTGGIAVVGTNNLTGMYQAIVRDTSAYYVLGYTPPIEHRDGKFHDIRVRVKRPGLTVRARKGYFASRPDVSAAVEKPLPEGLSTAARDALRMPLPVRGLAVDVFSAPFKGAGGESSVVIGSQIAGALDVSSDANVTVSWQIFDLDGSLRAGEYKVFTVNPAPTRRARLDEAGLRFLDRIELPPGRYELRLVADQPDGSLGSVVAPLEVPSFDEDLALSGITLAAASTASDLTLHEDEAIHTAHGMHPTAIRRFVRGDVLSLFAEVYSNDRRITAEDLTVTATMTDTAGVEIKREEATMVAPSAETTARGRWGFTTEISLLDLAPGRYVVTVEARAARRSTPERRSLVITVAE